MGVRDRLAMIVDGHVASLAPCVLESSMMGAVTLRQPGHWMRPLFLPVRGRSNPYQAIDSWSGS